MNAENQNDPGETLNKVIDRKSFYKFVESLIMDRKDAVAKEAIKPSSPYGPQANGWENSTIESYLEAALAWAEDTEMGESQGLGANLSWKTFATFLYCGKIYE